MPQGVVAWFDEESETKIRNLWLALAEVGVPSCAQYVQRGHAAYAPGRWTPHVTLASAVPQSLVGAAMELCARHLPIEATLSTGGIEDGTTEESWLVGSLP